MIAQVFINSANLHIDKPFDYLVPEALESKVFKGVRVKVPFGGGNLPMEAYVVECKAESEVENLKSVRSVIDKESVLSERATELCFYMRKRYFCSFSECAKLMLPPGTGLKFEEWVCLVSGAVNREEKLTLKQEQLLNFLKENDGSAEMLQLKNALGKNVRTTVNILIEKGYVEKNFRDKRKVREKFVRLAYYKGDKQPSLLADDIENKFPNQAKVLRALSFSSLSVPDIINLTGVTRNAVEALYVKGLIDYKEVENLRNPLEGKEISCNPLPRLTEAQKNAVDTVLHGSDNKYLLHGVTGSGKTEVYLRLVENALHEGKQAIVLVPEISLTPMMTTRFYERFGDTVAVLHSALSMGERLDEWNRINRGKANVVVGARSAIFAPCKNIGIIICDEEHDFSYKSESSPRYHVREIAEFLCKRENCKLVLGSATPSVESYYKAKTGQYKLVELPGRVNNNPLPKVYIEDMRNELREGNKTVLSRRLAYEIQKNLKNKEQSIIFLNRRGYSTFVSCRDCGFVYTCPNCSVSLTYHKNDDYLVCHYCGYREKIKRVCPKCGSEKIRDFGKGTQKAQEQIQNIFKDASLIRMDTDTTSGKRGHEKILEKFENEKTDILLGTQMVTNGLDFDNVTLVGVLAADASLNADDFRAQERTFNLITQVVGRAGRGEKQGRAVVQTYNPDSDVLSFASKQDYGAFFEDEIEFRRAFNYPPFTDICNIMISSSDDEEASLCAKKIGERLSASLKGERDCTLYGPSRAPIARIMGRYRYRIFIKCHLSDNIIDSIRDIIHGDYGKRKSDMSCYADINPYSMN